MKKEWFILTLLLLLVIPTVSAVNTEIKIKTMPFHEVQVTTYNPESESFHAYERFRGESDKYGDITFTATKDEVFNMIVFVKWQEETIVSEKFEEEYSTGKEVYVEIAKSGFEFIETPGEETTEEETTTEEESEEGNTEEENGEDGATEEETTEEGNTEEETTEEETTTEENQDAEEGSGTTGFSVFGEGGISSKTYWFVGIGLLIVIIALFVLKRKSMFKNAEGEETPTAGKKDPDALAKEVEKAERRIAEAQTEINKIKNRKRISEAEKKLDEDRKRLEKLRKGEIEPQEQPEEEGFRF